MYFWNARILLHMKINVLHHINRIKDNTLLPEEVQKMYLTSQYPFMIPKTTKLKQKKIT
jgi:hypothetical protein